ncbi:type IV secretion system protein [Sphingomonas sp.]|uniref:type IV secretion system protein n=1 Tax=Sphingomonas sp. TaxID=28214 RepID=UPI0038AB5F2B
MTQCQPFTADGPAGVADALSKVDCLASDATAVSFGRLFGAHGSFQTALTIILTLYVALLAFNILTGRSALRVSVLTPRMMTLGLVLTFATSWIAYQSVVWNLAMGAPDEIASVLVGTRGSATTIFAQQLDGVFTAITDAASAITPAAAAAPGMPAAAAVPTMASPANILSIAGLILLLGTVGVLVVCRLALAALLILGPIFIVLALFDGTRGLFEGWLKSVAMFALVPLLTVIMGSGALVAISPMVAGLGEGGAEISLRSAVSILVASIIYVALMLVVFKVAASLTKGWRMGRAQALAQAHMGAALSAHQERPLNPAASAAPATAVASERVRSTVASLENSSSSHRLLTSGAALAAIAAPAPRPALAGPNDARNQLRYLHHRVAGAATPHSREMFR